MRRMYLGLVFIALFVKANAQNSTNVGLQLANFVSPQFYNEALFSIPIKTVGFSITHVLYKNLAIKAGYQFWVNPFGSTFYGDPFDMVVWDKDAHITTRANYKIIDFGGLYGKEYKQHQMFADIAASVATGEIQVITGIYQQPGYPDRLVETETYQVRCAGIKYEIGYNYLLFKNRMNAGVSVSSRNYFGKDAFTQYNLNVNFGYNFSLMKRKQTSKD